MRAGVGGAPARGRGRHPIRIEAATWRAAVGVVIGVGRGWASSAGAVSAMVARVGGPYDIPAVVA